MFTSEGVSCALATAPPPCADSASVKCFLHGHNVGCSSYLPELLANNRLRRRCKCAITAGAVHCTALLPKQGRQVAISFGNKNRSLRTDTAEQVNVEAGTYLGSTSRCFPTGTASVSAPTRARRALGRLGLLREQGRELNSAAHHCIQKHSKDAGLEYFLRSLEYSSLTSLLLLLYSKFLSLLQYKRRQSSKCISTVPR